jgi:hypothetical protein
MEETARKQRLKKCQKGRKQNSRRKLTPKMEEGPGLTYY